MIRCGRNGAVLLYGTKCVGCDCQLAGFADGGTIPRDAEAPRFFGVDLASGPDRTATARVRMHRDYGFTIEEIDFPNVTSKATAEAMARHQRRVEEELARAIYGSGYANPFARRDARPGVEIITDPNDRRGFDARRVGPCL